MSHWKWFLAAPLGAMLVFSLANAQDQNPGGGGRNRGPGGGGFDPAQMRERRLNDLKEQLSSTDDEWKVLSPKVSKVMEAQIEMMSGGFGGGRGGRGGRGGGPGGGDNANRGTDRPQSKLAEARQSLRDTLDNKSASSEEITKKLAALREARDKARTALQAAQKDLKELCTPRQEAVLVVSGMLD